MPFVFVAWLMVPVCQSHWTPTSSHNSVMEATGSTCKRRWIECCHLCMPSPWPAACAGPAYVSQYIHENGLMFGPFCLSSYSLCLRSCSCDHASCFQVSQFNSLWPFCCLSSISLSSISNTLSSLTRRSTVLSILISDLINKYNSHSPQTCPACS